MDASDSTWALSAISGLCKPSADRLSFVSVASSYKSNFQLVNFCLKNSNCLSFINTSSLLGV